MTFTQFQHASAERSHQAFPECAEWTISDWGVALAGETGEACNFIKKMRRQQSRFPGQLTANRVARMQLVESIGKELADVITYAERIASELDLDLETLVRAKFNEVSDRVGSRIRL